MMARRSPLACAVRSALFGCVATLAVACASSHKKLETPVLAAANPGAVAKLVQGVQSAKDPNGKDRAIGLLKDALTADPGLWEAHYNLGVLLADKGDLSGAERELTQAGKLAPNAEDVVVALSEVRRRNDDANGAIEALQTFVKQNPDAKIAPIALITALREGGQVRQAIEQAQRVLVYHSSDPFALSELALANVELGELDTAELLIEEALKADDKSAVAERAAGLISLKKGEDAVAFKHFQHASELDPKDTTARLNTGTVFLQAGVYDKAAQEFRAVLETEPESSDAMLGLAAARRGQGKRDDQSGYLEAEKLLKQLLEREPKNLDATFNLAILYTDYLKRPGDATPLLQRFLLDAPKNHPGRPEAERIIAGAQTAKK
ncbi:MAG: tetratricopeptide repeat protein [Pseudomonadota bacterium]